MSEDDFQTSPVSRRDFLATTTGVFGSGWLWLNLPLLTSLSACARDDARANAAFTTLTAGEGATMRAFAARILPSGDGLPGAEEAGAAWFADSALAGPFAGMKEPVSAGLADLDTRMQAAHGVAFHEADEAQQDAIMRDVEDTEFFFMGRMLTVMGMFASEEHGGRSGHRGYELVGMDHAAAFQPPFGWYDAEHARLNGGAA